MGRDIDVGVDLGTTVTKAVALADDGRVLARAAVPTHWDRPAPDQAQRDPDEPSADVDRLLADLVAAAGDVRVRSVGFCSIAETGTLVDAAGRARMPLVAWHDPRGAAQARALPDPVRRALPARTGLEVGPVASLFTMLWMREVGGLDLRGLQWLSLPELVCHRLGGVRVAERSMLGRTALLDVHNGAPWDVALDLLGAGDDLVPPVVAAGASLGRIREDHPVPQARGAVLTVAGHDHLVAAAAVGAGAAGTLCASLGTAEALVGALPTPPEPAAVAALVARGMSVYPHVVDGTTCLLGAQRTGLVLGHTLDALGAGTAAERRALVASFDPDATPAAVEVQGLAMSDEHVEVRWALDAEPAAVWRGVLDVARTRIADDLSAARDAGVVVDELVVTGGWARLPSVLASREGLAARTRLETLEEPGAHGAALLARWAAGQPAGVDPCEQRGPAAGWFADLAPTVEA